MQKRSRKEYIGYTRSYLFHYNQITIYQYYFNHFTNYNNKILGLHLFTRRSYNYREKTKASKLGGLNKIGMSSK